MRSVDLICYNKYIRKGKGMNEPITEDDLEDLTFDELIELAALEEE